jgi:cysteinyl-tRNA synthetase
MDDDFNTPEALAVLFDLAREINRLKESDVAVAAALAGVLRELGRMLGILQDDPDTWLKGGITINVKPAHINHGIIPETDSSIYTDERIDELIEQREDARKSKNWAKADCIRDDLQAAGIVLEDGPQGTTWRRG